MTAPGGLELLVILVILVLLLAPLVLVVWTAVDAANRSEAAFQAAGQQRTLWIVLPPVLMVARVGWILSLVYVLAIRPKVAATGL